MYQECSQKSFSKKVAPDILATSPINCRLVDTNIKIASFKQWPHDRKRFFALNIFLILNTCAHFWKPNICHITAQAKKCLQTVFVADVIWGTFWMCCKCPIDHGQALKQTTEYTKRETNIILPSERGTSIILLSYKPTSTREVLHPKYNRNNYYTPKYKAHKYYTCKYKRNKALYSQVFYPHA